MSTGSRCTRAGNKPGSCPAELVHRIEPKGIPLGVVTAHADELGHATLAPVAGNVRYQVDGKRDRLARAGVRQPDVGGQDAMREPCERVLSNVVLDIDLDYFSCSEGANTPRSLEISKREFDDLASNRYHFLRISQGSRVTTTEQGGRYFLHLNSYPDRAQEPRRVDQAAVEERVDELMALLRFHAVRPRLIEISRSRFSGYTPSDDWAAIESTVVAGLRSLYDLERGSLDQLCDRWRA